MGKPEKQDWAEAEVELQAPANASGCSGVEVSIQQCPKGGKGMGLLCFYICLSLDAGFPWEAGLIVGKAALGIFPFGQGQCQEKDTAVSPQKPTQHLKNDCINSE